MLALSHPRLCPGGTQNLTPCLCVFEFGQLRAVCQKIYFGVQLPFGGKVLISIKVRLIAAKKGSNLKVCVTLGPPVSNPGGGIPYPRLTESVTGGPQPK